MKWATHDHLYESLEVKLNTLLQKTKEIEDQLSIELPKIRKEAGMNLEVIERMLSD